MRNTEKSESQLASLVSTLIDKDDENDAAFLWLAEACSHADHVDPSYAPMWHGWALRAAFLAGVQWQRKRLLREHGMEKPK